MKGFLLRNAFAAIFATILFTIFMSYIPIFIEKMGMVAASIPS